MIAPTQMAGIAQIVARNIVPLVGIIFFNWSASNVLILYFVDTLLSMAVIFAGLAGTFAPAPPDGIVATVKAELTYVLTAVLVAGIIGIPIGMPVGIALATSDFSWRFALYDTSLRNGLLVQIALSLWSYIDLRRALKTFSREQLQLKRRFAFVFMRWVAVLIACYTVLEFLGGDLAVYLLVVVYIGASIFAEVAPERFLEVMPGGADMAKETPDKLAASRGDKKQR
jgi:hypothetical protein